MPESIPTPGPESTEPRRKALPKRLRFEVFRRDNHACRYCGQMAPDVKLTIDHVIPVVLGGSDDPDNLVTACADCNAGKSSVPAGADLVADVAQDAMRWRAAMAQAQALAQDEYANREEWMKRFRSFWDNWTYCSDGKSVELPANWRTALDQFRGVGLVWADFNAAIEQAMTGYKIRDEFAYMLTILRNKMAERTAVARALLDQPTPGGEA